MPHLHFNMIRNHDSATSYRKNCVRITIAILLYLSHPASLAASQDIRFDEHSRTRGLVWGWGHSWTPGFGKTKSDLAFGAFHPQIGWFLTDRLELYGEATHFVYHEPRTDMSLGFVGIAGRYHFWNDRSWAPFVTAGAGFLWTTLKVPEIDRAFNFQLTLGGGVRFIPERGPGWIMEFRNHHISNAGTAGQNLGVNAAMFLFGIQWILR